MDDYPVQGKLRIRADQYEAVRAYLEPRVGKLSAGTLKSMPGYEFLKFYYADFAATPAQWAEIQPEMDRRNVLVTMYEAPVLYMEALEEEEEQAAEQERTQTPLLARLASGAAVLIALAGMTLVVYGAIDFAACLGFVVLAALVGAAGPVYAHWRGAEPRRRDRKPE